MEPNFQPIRRRLTKKSLPYGKTSIEYRPAEDVAKDLESLYEMTYHVQEDEMILAMEFPYLETKKDWKNLAGRPECYMTNQLRRKRVEVTERTATQAERELIRTAKDKEH